MCGDGDEGAAFVFLGSAIGHRERQPRDCRGAARVGLRTRRCSAQRGLAGDVNGDGYADVIVGAPLTTTAQTDGGAAFVFLGGASGIGHHTFQTADSPDRVATRAVRRWAFSVASAGDVNGDGYCGRDRGCLSLRRGPDQRGAAFVFLGERDRNRRRQPACHSATTPYSSSRTRRGAVFGEQRGLGRRRERRRLRRRDRGRDALRRGQRPTRARRSCSSAARQGIANRNPAHGRYAARVEPGRGLRGVVGVRPKRRIGRRRERRRLRRRDRRGAFYDDGDSRRGRARSSSSGSASGIADGNPRRPPPSSSRTRSTRTSGASVASAGDVNGDGYGDVIAGRARVRRRTTDEGAAFVFHRAVRRGSRTARRPRWPHVSQGAQSLQAFVAARLVGHVRRGT